LFYKNNTIYLRALFDNRKTLIIMKMTTFWENERRKLLGQPLIADDDTQANTAIDAPQAAVLQQAEEQIESATKSTIFYTEGNSEKGHDEVFKSAGWRLREEYNSHNKYGKARAASVKNGREIIDALNKNASNSLQRLDILGHGGHSGIFFSWEFLNDIPYDNPIIQEGQNLLTSGARNRKANFYANSLEKDKDASRLYPISPNAGSADEVQYSIFKSNAIIEFHACHTAGYPPEHGKGDQTLNCISYWCSKYLFAAGNLFATAIGHYGGAGPGKALLLEDYRSETRVVYWNGEIILKTQQKGDLWDTIQSILLKRIFGE
jgi:hypothetical protein